MVKKYLGSPITAYAAIVSPLFICLPLLFGFTALSSQINEATICVFLGCILCTVIWGLWLKGNAIQLYTWGVFQRDGIRVKTLFSQSYLLQYKQCFGCGIGYYTHGILNSPIGTKIYFIFFSYENFDEEYRSRINLWKPTKTRIKVKFSKDLYRFLMAVLPKAQSQMLSRDYKKYEIGDDSLS